MEEIDLIEQARSSPEAFSVLYQSYLPRVYAYIYRRIGNRKDSEDLTSQILMEVLEGLRKERYLRGGYFAAWVFTIAHRRLVDFYRRRPETTLDENVSIVSDLDTHMENHEDHSRLVELLSGLDADKQEMLRLRFSAGLSFSEIARILNRSESAVKMTVYRALDSIRERWEADNE